MHTSNLSQTAPLAVVPSRPPSFAWLSPALHRVQAFLVQALAILEPSEQTYQQISFPATPLRFSGKSVYTPLQDWNGNRESVTYQYQLQKNPLMRSFIQHL